MSDRISRRRVLVLGGVAVASMAAAVSAVSETSAECGWCRTAKWSQCRGYGGIRDWFQDWYSSKRCTTTACYCYNFCSSHRTNSTYDVYCP